MRRSRSKDTDEKDFEKQAEYLAKEKWCESAMATISNREPRDLSFCLDLTLPLSDIYERIHCQTHYFSPHFSPTIKCLQES